MTEPSIPTDTKYCSACKQIKPVDCFYRRRDRPCGHSAKCKTCRNAYHASYIKTPKGQRSIKESSRKYWLKYGKQYSQDPVKKAAMNAAALRHSRSEKGIRARRNRHLRAKYGITLAEYEQLFKSQNQACAICGYQGTTRKFHLDHNHRTGNVRGILCNPCNGAIGLMQDDTKRLQQAIEYLMSHAS